MSAFDLSLDYCGEIFVRTLKLVVGYCDPFFGSLDDVLDGKLLRFIILGKVCPQDSAA